MSTPDPIDTDAIWRRVGLEELRQALRHIEDAMGSFQKTVQGLPPCNTCARARLLEHIRATSHRLGTEVVSLSVLADAMRMALEHAERTQARLMAQPPDPCRCDDRPCTCHD